MSKVLQELSHNTYQCTASLVTHTTSTT